MATTQRDIMLQALKALLRPLVRFCLRHSLKLQDCVEILKAVFLEVAEEQLSSAGTAVSDSRLSVMTGVHRRDVVRLGQDEVQQKASPDLLSKVLGHWLGHRKFSTSSKKPRVLSYAGKESEFASLVSSVSQDLNPYTVLFELERTGAVEKTRRGLKLKNRAYIPKGDLKSGFTLAATDVEHLFSCVEENLLSDETMPHLHLRTEYDNISESNASLIKDWLLREGSAFHQRARNFLSHLDLDHNKNASACGKKIRIALGTFSHIKTCQ